MPSCFDVDSIRGLLTLARSYGANFGTTERLGWIPYNFDNSVIAQVPAYKGVNRKVSFPRQRRVSAIGTSTLQRECVQILPTWRYVISIPRFAILHKIPSIAYFCAFVTAEVAKVEEVL